MIFKSNSINERKIDKIVGPAISFSFKSLEITGSPTLFIKKMELQEHSYDDIFTDSKCFIEKRPHGIIIRVFKSNERYAIALPKSELDTICLTKGKEIIEPLRFSLMWMLLKLGIKIRYTRHFNRYGQYRIDESSLTIKSQNMSIFMIASGFDYYRQLRFLKSLSYDEILQLKYL